MRRAARPTQSPSIPLVQKGTPPPAREFPPPACAVALLLAALALGCGPAESPPPDAAAPEAAAPETAALEPIPRPDLANLPAEVRDQLAAERAALDALLARDDVPAAELGDRLGRLGQLYHAYDLAAAEPCYRNAARRAPDDPRWPYLLAVLAAARGEPVAAAGRLERVLELEPDNPAAALRLAEARLAEARHDEARSLFAPLLEIPEATAAAHYGLGRAASAAGDYRAAIEHLEKVLELQPGAVNVHYVLAAAYNRTGDREAAQRHIDLGGTSEVTFPDPWVREVEDLASGLGSLLEDALAAMQGERYEEAVEHYRAALEIEPESAGALRGLGLALRKAGDLVGATAAYRRMLGHHPEHALARLELATVLLEREEFDEAVEVFESAIELDPDFKEAHLNLGVALSRAGRWREAASRFREVLRIDERYPLARYYLATALVEQGETNEAIAVLRQEVGSNPNLILPRQRLGELLAKSGDREGAREQHRAVLGLDPPPQEAAVAHFQLGLLAPSSEEAISRYREALLLLPELWQARFNIGNVLQQDGRPLEAAAEYAKLVAAQPDHVLARVREAEALALAGRSGEARQRLEAALEALPESVDVAHAMARLLAAAPDVGVRNGAAALRLAEQVFAVRPTLEHGETVAMALAELERFAEAAERQRRLLEAAERQGLEDAVPRLRRNLARYERGERPG